MVIPVLVFHYFVFATLFYCSFDFLIYFRCIILSFLIFRWIVILILFLPRSFSAVLLFIHVFFCFIIFSDSFYDKFFGRDIFYLLQFYSQWFLFFRILFTRFFTCHLFHRFYQQAVFYQAGYFVRLSYDIGVELFVVLFSIFCCFWSWSIFCILSLSQPYTYDTTLLYTDTTFLISTNINRTTNQSIFQPIKQINQLICPCNIPDQLIYFT